MAAWSVKRSSFDAQLDAPTSTTKKSGLYDRVSLNDHLKEMFNDPKDSDLTVKVTDGVRYETFHLHRVILKRSVYFARMLDGGLKETKECEIELKDTPPSEMNVLLEWLYTDRLDTDGLDMDRTVNLFKTADQY